MELSFNKQLQQVCKEKNNYLCIGLDIDPNKFIKGRDTSIDGIYEFGKEVINGTIDFCPIYKPNFAFFERYGSQGYSVLEKLVDHINGRAIVIADAKRGDIGNTSKYYYESILNVMGCDAITISPYMGRDAIKPFISDSKKGVFILALTSNPSALEIQNHGAIEKPMFAKVIEIANELNKKDNIGLVVGATQVDLLDKVELISKNMPWLIPGIGSQGGDLNQIINADRLGIINVSRSILYAGQGTIEDIVDKAQDYTYKIRNLICNQLNY